jgi:exopolyphosphatase / guanosine-5'-triphosphate,3'-diphosphate pyrophosphatase
MTNTHTPRLLAVVDLGSNSFRLNISKLIETSAGYQFQTLDSLKEPVRLAAGLASDGTLDAPALARANLALMKFGERLRSFQPETVRAVATSTFRVAKTSEGLQKTAEAALGFPIEIISGHEEARLIYSGAAHELRPDDQNRLVIDIGGGSTECIVGNNQTAICLESALVGCVSLSHKHFADGVITQKRFDEAYYKARSRFEPYANEFKSKGWEYAVGTSGTAKALSQMCERNFDDAVIQRKYLNKFKEQLVVAGKIDNVDMTGLKEDRRHVYAGGLAVMLAVFDEFDIESMTYCNSALRHGLLYDLVQRKGSQDMREVTVLELMRRYAIDTGHAKALSDTACGLFDQAAKGSLEELQEHRLLLRWAASLADSGLSISHEDFHKHSAYILSHVDMQGFSQSEQNILANLALAQTGGMRKLRDVLQSPLDWITAMCLRIAFILHRRRDKSTVPLPELTYRQKVLSLRVSASWLQAHPLSRASLEAEFTSLNELKIFGEAVFTAK